jgi:hypothetical protein
MRKTKKLHLNRETLRYLIVPEAELRGAAGGATTPITQCVVSVCVNTCVKLCTVTGPPVCSARIECSD